MRKLLIAAAAVALAAGFAAAANAAPAPSPYCKMANSQRNPVAWNAYYHCHPTAALPAKKTQVAARTRKTQAQAKNPYCAMASSQRNVVSWNAQYHCLNR